jgi:hypothetical protein
MPLCGPRWSAFGPSQSSLSWRYRDHRYRGVLRFVVRSAFYREFGTVSDELPREISRGTMLVGPLELEVINLDNGQRLITPESMEAFMEWLERGGEPEPIKNVTPGRA